MLSERHLRGIEERDLSVETAAAMGLYSGRRLRDGSIVPDEDGHILCIPYFDRGKEVNTKYRWHEDGQRRFMQRKNAVKTLYNGDILHNEELMKLLMVGTEALIWEEGEFDVIATIECGFPTVVSVPDGAPPARDKNGRLIQVPDDDRDIDPEDDDKFSFMGRFMDELFKVKHHIIATDGDEPGQRLAKELVRRLGAAKCFWITYPPDEVVPDTKGRKGDFRRCKDMNEVKKYLGPDKVREIIENAKPWPVNNLYKLSDYPDQELPPMAEVGISPAFDEKIKLYPGQFVVCTGVPNAGKSTLINQIVTRAAKVHKWPVAMFSGEKDVKPFLAEELMTAYLEKPKKRWTSDDRERATNFVERYFRFIDYGESSDVDMDVDFILTKAATAVFRDGIRVLVIDPWNELEHKRPNNMSLTEYVGAAIKRIKRFAKDFQCCVIVVAHPTKLDPKQMPSLYSISDSAHWANKADLGLVVFAEDPDQPGRLILIPKVRLKRIAGNTGAVPLDFDLETSLFKPAPF